MSLSDPRVRVTAAHFASHLKFHALMKQGTPAFTPELCSATRMRKRRLQPMLIATDYEIVGERLTCIPPASPVSPAEHVRLSRTEVISRAA